MSSVVSSKEIAATIETALNATSVKLLGLGFISEGITFNITSDFQEYTEMENAQDVTFTPGVLQMVGGEVGQAKGYSEFNDDYLLNIYGYHEQRDILRDILNDYSLVQSQITETIGDWRAVKKFSRPTLIGPTLLDGIDRMIGTLLINYTFTELGVGKNDCIIEINGEIVPYHQFKASKEKNPVGYNFVNTTTTKSLNTKLYNVYSIIMPYVRTNDVTVRILQDILTDNFFSATYNINYEDPNINVNRFMSLSSGGYTIKDGEINSIDAVFTDARKEISL